MKSQGDKQKKVIVAAITKGGEQAQPLKINPNKRHSKNNTIIGWSVYENGIYKYSMFV